jgi:teichuronic acid biosynthesis glycosyltransferase TuaG
MLGESHTNVSAFASWLPDAMPAKSSDLVSIITPAYRASKIIGQTIASVCAQTYANWEMLIADDCSPDGTREVVRHWILHEQRVRLLELECHGGPALARNAALQAAQGVWVAFLDADDLWLPTKIERSIAFATAENSPFVFTGFRRMSADGSRSGRYIGVPRRLGYRQLLGNTAIATSTVVLDRRVTGPIEMRNTYFDDFDLWLRILKQGHTARGLDEDLMRCRVMSQSRSRNKRHSAREVWRAYRGLERLTLPASLGYFSQYALHAVLKYHKF